MKKVPCVGLACYKKRKFILERDNNKNFNHTNIVNAKGHLLVVVRITTSSQVKSIMI